MASSKASSIAIIALKGILPSQLKSAPLIQRYGFRQIQTAQFPVTGIHQSGPLLLEELPLSIETERCRSLQQCKQVGSWQGSVDRWKYEGMQSWHRRFLGPPFHSSLVSSRQLSSKSKKRKNKQNGYDDLEDDEDSDSGKGKQGKGKAKGGIDTSAARTPADIVTEMKGQMDAALDALSRELGKLRTGRASPGMLDHVIVDAYGAPTPLSRVATVSLRDSQTLSVSLHDPGLAAAVEKGIRSSPMGLNPVAEGASLVVPISQLSQETRQAMTKLVVKAGETVKLSLRRSRKEAMDALKSGADSLPKDEVKRTEREIQDSIGKYEKLAGASCKAREQDILKG